MSMPSFYAPPEQVMKEKADFARKGIARGRSLIACQYADGILLVAENPSNTLRKISEIYDRIGFAGVGKYNEFDQLRQAGVRSADIKGYQYSRSDVDARSLASIYARTMGSIFTHEAKPLEVEILVAEVGTAASTDRMFHILYDGTVMDESRFSVLGGDAETIAERMTQAFVDGAPLKDALNAATRSLGGSERSLRADDLEVAVLERNSHRRCFRRLDDEAVVALMQS